jgi:hypothetical protein
MTSRSEEQQRRPQTRPQTRPQIQQQTQQQTQQQPHQKGRPATGDAGRRAGPRWLWFGVLGGGLAWTIHLMAAWLLDELGCTHGSQHVFGLPLRLAVGAATVLPGLVAVAALVVAGRALRVLRRAQQDPPPGVAARQIDRARFMAEVALWVDALSVTMIVFGGVAVLTFPACTR